MANYGGSVLSQHQFQQPPMNQARQFGGAASIENSSTSTSASTATAAPASASDTVNKTLANLHQASEVGNVG